MEQVSRTLAIMVPIIVAALSIGSMVAVAIVGFLGGRAVGTGLVEPSIVVLVLRICLGALLILTLILTTSSPGQSTTTRYTRLLILPIGRRTLHAVEVASHFGDPWLVLGGLGVMALAAGLVAGGRPGAAFAAAAAGLVVMAALGVIAAVTTFLVSWLFKSRRRGEMFTLVLVLGLSLLSFIPAFLSRDLDRRDRSERADRRPAAVRIREFDEALPAWTRLLPTEIYGDTVLAAVASQARPAIVGGLLLVAELGLLGLASSAVHRRLLAALESDRSRRAIRARQVSGQRLPFISARASAVAWAQYRTALRSVRGRLAVLLPGPLFGLMVVLFRGMPDEEWARHLDTDGHLLAGVTLVFSIYVTQAFSMNLFGSDRAGLTLQLLSPLSDRDIAWGKIVGTGLITGAAGALSILVALVVAPTGSPYYWAATMVGAVAAFILLGPIMIWLSALFPVPSDLSKTGAGGNPHPVPTLAGTFLILLAAAPTAVLLLLAEYSFRMPAVALAGALVWLGVVGVLSIPAVRLAARTIGARRENLALIAQGK
jgi:hypothetical protein